MLTFFILISLLIIFLLFWLFRSEEIEVDDHFSDQEIEADDQEIEADDLENNQEIDEGKEILDYSPSVRDILENVEAVNYFDSGRRESKGERICRATLENIYGVPFPNIRPDFLINPETGARLELDCYNKDLGIAVEYNGEQHYKFPNRFSKTKKDFINQVRRDMLKAELCDRNKIYLITVPYNVPHDMIPGYIVYFLRNIDPEIKIEENH